MGTKSPKRLADPVSGLEVLSRTPPDGAMLLVRHVHSGGAITLRSGMRGMEADPDITVARRCEVVVAPQWAKTSTDLKKFVRLGWLDVRWVEPNYEPRTQLPLPEDAPGDIITYLDKSERRFALDAIALQEDTEQAIAAVQTQVKQPEPRDRVIDTRYMRDKFYHVLELAEWLEKQINNRKAVLEAIKSAKAAIRDM